VIKNTDSDEVIKEKLMLFAVFFFGMKIFEVAGAGQYSFFGGMAAMFGLAIYWKKTGKLDDENHKYN